MNFDLDLEDLRVIGLALEASPWKVANPVITKINRQIREQQQAEEDGKRNTDS